MTEMIERVARAIYAVRHPGIDTDTASRALAFGDGRYFLPGWKAYEEDACAAIEAMRDPTDEMLAAAELLSMENSTDSKIYTAMIDASIARKGDT